MSELVLPRNLSLPARLVLGWAFTCHDDRGEVQPAGKPPTAVKRLTNLTGLHDASVRYAVRELEEASLMQTQVIGRGRGRGVHMRIFLLLDRLKVEGVGECGHVTSTAGQRFCARCKQLEGRDDRAWQLKAKEYFFEGIPIPVIATRLSKGIYLASDDDGRSANGGAIVPFLAEDPDTSPFLKKEWRDRLAEIRKGSVVEDA